jgi:hypothetical protein
MKFMSTLKYIILKNKESLKLIDSLFFYIDNSI